MAATGSTRPRWFHPTPDRFVIGLLAVECLLWLSERFRWFPFNQHKNWTVLIALAAVGTGMLLMGLWFVAGLLFRWRFQFSIRSLLVLVVVVAIPCSWLATEMRKAKQEREAASEIEELRGAVFWDGGSSRLPQWLRRQLGDEFFDSVVVAFPNSTDAGMRHLKWLSELQELRLDDTGTTDAGLENLDGLSELRDLWLDNTKVTDAGLEKLQGLSQLWQLRLDGTKVTNAGLEHLKGLSRLQYLSLGGTMVTDAGLRYVKGLSELRCLSLCGTNVTNAGLEHLKGLSQLDSLLLDDTKVTDAGLEQLKGLRQLGLLSLDGTKVTEEGLEKLRKALPNCEIRLRKF